MRNESLIFPARVIYDNMYCNDVKLQSIQYRNIYRVRVLTLPLWGQLSCGRGVNSPDSARYPRSTP